MQRADLARIGACAVRLGSMRALWVVLIPHLLCAFVGFQQPWGRDAGLALARQPAVKAVRALSPPGEIMELLIVLRQRVLTKADGPRSHYRPSSSVYMHEAIQKYGFCRGYLMGCDRLLRENDEMWVYRLIDEHGKLYKFDPPP